MRKTLQEFYRLNKRDSHRAAVLLSRAFQDWPVAVALVPDEERRKNRSKYAYKMTINYCIKFGEAYAPTQDLEGVGMLIHSDKDIMSTWQMIKHGALKILFKLGTKFVDGMEQYADFLEKLANEAVERPYYHLMWLAVEPELQKTGIGTQLMHAILDKCNKDNLRCYLDTQEKENVEYYKRFGFKVVNKGKFPHIDVMCWGMLWEPNV